MKLFPSIFLSLLLPLAVAAQSVQIQDGAIRAEFSVSDSTKVYFSQGNLLYEAIDKRCEKCSIWWFAEHQWNRNSTYEYDEDDYDRYTSEWFNLFPWGTSGYNGKEPEMISTTSMTSITSYNYGDGTNDIAGTNYDWGVYNAIFNGGNKTGQWRTLTKEEWNYLIKNRANASEKYGVANVEGVNGLILLPDNWELSKDIVFTSGVLNVYNGSGYYLNNYTASEWAKLETGGAVFLPTVIDRAGGDILGVYWSSSACGDKQAYCLYFTYQYLGINSTPRAYRMAVRLVQDVK